jgi:hypothetical protein
MATKLTTTLLSNVTKFRRNNVKYTYLALDQNYQACEQAGKYNLQIGEKIINKSTQTALKMAEII